ncbi:MAG TPA: trehalase family glycosidase [Phycisphaerae bacterium]|nr:trehalase family glycosidase [Phycisphaerae bacterium]
MRDEFGHGMKAGRQTAKMWRGVCAAACLAGCVAAAGCGARNSSGAAGAVRSGARSPDIRHYIVEAWGTLTRSPTNCAAMVDAKLPPGESVLYVPADQERTAEMERATAACGVRIVALPAGARAGEVDPSALGTPGLLYLPHDYVVPGGRFNEMYGWDSFFIVEGLVQGAGDAGGAERVALARGMTENFFYELEHYGAILNANRSYYLTRSQPPFLTSMVQAVAGAEHGSAAEEGAWLAAGYRAGQEDWAFWNRAESKAGETGLARYYDYGSGPVPEMHDDPAYYENVVKKLAGMGEAGRPFLRAVRAGETGVPEARVGGLAVTLTDDFYKGDRAMRESGFDVSFRFGPYGGATHHFAAVGLNALLYKEERDLAGMAERLGKTEEAATWRGRAEKRKEAVDRYLWDAKSGMYFDYDFVAGKRSGYAFATTFWPLWAGLATPEQARRVAGHLGDFERAGGLATSTTRTGVQWDYPYGWAPLQMLAVDGLRRYGFDRQADALAERWLRMIVENYRREGTLREKYDVVTRSADVEVQVGYSQNVVGFGWTNGVFLKLLGELPAGERGRVLR